MASMKQRMIYLFRICRVLSTVMAISTIPPPWIDDNNVSLLFVSVHYTCAGIVVLMMFYAIHTTLTGLIKDLDRVNEGKEGSEINDKVPKVNFIQNLAPALTLTLALALVLKVESIVGKLRFLKVSLK